MTPTVMSELQKFIETLNKAMPGAWEATIKQVYIHGVLWLIAGTVFGYFCLSCKKEYERYNGKEEKDKSEEDTSWQTFITFAGFFLALFATISYIFGAMHLINPEYQAIRMLLP